MIALTFVCSESVLDTQVHVLNYDAIELNSFTGRHIIAQLALTLVFKDGTTAMYVATKYVSH